MTPLLLTLTILLLGLISTTSRYPSQQQIIASLTDNSGNFSAVRFKKACYALINGQKAVFPDRFTIETLGYQVQTLPVVDWNFISTYPDTKTPLKTLWDHHGNEKFLAMGNHSSFLQAPQLVFKNLLNPCFIYWNGDIAISWRKEEHSIRVIYIKVDEKQFSSLGNKIAAHIEMFKTYDFNDNSIPHVDFNGEDPRIFTVGDYVPGGNSQVLICILIVAVLQSVEL
jgi:hypothetical protein